MPKAESEAIVLRNVAPKGSPAHSKWTFPWRDRPGSEGLIVGSPSDTAEALRALGLPARTPKCPSPVISISRGEWDELDPVAQSTIRWLVANRAFTVENLPPEAA